MDASMIRELKEKVAKSVRILVAEGLIENRGHVSVRVPGEDLCVLPGHIHLEGRTVGDITPDEVVVANFEGVTVDGAFEPPDEVFIHTEVYKARPDVSSVVHTHSPMATIVGIARQSIIPVNLEGAIFAKGVPLYEWGGRVVTKEEGEKLAKALGSSWAILLCGHGTVNVGTNIEQACVVAVHLEKTARLQYHASLLGKAFPLTDDAINWEFVLGTDYYNPTWAYLEAKLSKTGLG